MVSASLQELLRRQSISAQILSSDKLRRVMTPRPSYSLEERETVYDTLVYVAGLLTANGVNVIIDATGNLRKYRDKARARLPRFFEVYLTCSLQICAEREAKRRHTFQAPRNIYGRAARGKAPTVPGVGQPYEEPPEPNLKIDTAECSPEECAQVIFRWILRSRL